MDHNLHLRDCVQRQMYAEVCFPRVIAVLYLSALMTFLVSLPVYIAQFACPK